MGEKMKNFFKRSTNDLTTTWKGFKNEKIKPSTLLLVIANIFCLLISNIIAVKTLDLGLKFGAGSAFLEFTIPAAVIMYTFSIICSDLLCQLDPVWSRRSCHIGFILNLVMVGAFTFTIHVPGFISGIPSNGTTSNIGVVLGSSWFMLIASMLSFYFGDLLNDTVFSKLKKKDGDGNKKLIKRCILSTVCGQLVDSSIFITFGLFLLPKWVLGTPFIGFDWGTMSYGMWGGWASVLGTILVQFLVKITLELLVSPIIIKICNIKKQREINETVETVETTVEE